MILKSKFIVNWKKCFILSWNIEGFLNYWSMTLVYTSKYICIYIYFKLHIYSVNLVLANRERAALALPLKLKTEICGSLAGEHKDSCMEIYLWESRRKEWWGFICLALVRYTHAMLSLSLNVKEHAVRDAISEWTENSIHSSPQALLYNSRQKGFTEHAVAF